MRGMSKRSWKLVAVVSLASLNAGGPSASAAAANPVRTAAEPLRLSANLGERQLFVRDGDDSTVTFSVAIGTDDKPTPTGTFKIRKIVWNPAWGATGRKVGEEQDAAQPPGAKANPMKLVKIFFKEPDYYIHGTSDPITAPCSESDHGPRAA